jgi:hypothetical protein
VVELRTLSCQESCEEYGFIPYALEVAKRTLDEGHGFSRVSMSLRLTQGDENHSEVVFDCAAPILGRPRLQGSA